MSRASRVEVRILVAAAALVVALAAVVGAGIQVADASSSPAQVDSTTTTEATTTTTQATTTSTVATTTTAAPTTTLSPPTTRPHTTTTTARASTTTTAPVTSTTLATTSTSVEPSSSVTAPALSNPATSTTTKPKSTSSGGLSDSAKLSIVVVGLLAVGAAILVLTYLYWRRTRPASVTAVSPSALDALVGLDVDGPPTAPVPVVPASATTAAAVVGAGAVVGASTSSSAPDSGLHALVPPTAPPVAPPATPPVAPSVVPAGTQPLAVDGAAGLGGVTPDPRAGVRILGPAVGLSAALASAAADREQGDGAPPEPARATPTPIDPETVPPEPVLVLSSPPDDEAQQIARELWPTRDEPVVSDDSDGLADLWRAPLKIVTLEDLQQGATEPSPESSGADGVIDLGDDHG